MLDLEQELAAIVDALNAERIEYALCGGMAMAVHGEFRATVDVDLLVREEDVSCVHQVVAPLHETLILHLLPVSPDLESAWQARETRDWRGSSLSVMSPDGPIADHQMKLDIDYSDRAITQRIRQVSQLRKLCLSLARAKPVPPPPASKS